MASDTDVDEFVNYFKPKGIDKRKKFDYTFNARSKDKASFDAILSDFKTQIKTFNWSKYKKRGVVLHDIEGNVHVFSEGDK